MKTLYERKTKTTISHEHQCKYFQNNINKSSLKMFKKKYIPQQNGIFFMYINLSNFENQSINVIYHNNKLSKKTPMIISIDTHRAFEKHIL